MVKRKSKIFTNKEIEVLEERKKGIKKDNTGIYTSRIKPKIIELLNIWFKRRRELENVLEKDKRNKP